jgi:hypothetical protein
MKEGWYWTARDVVAEEGGYVDDEGQAKGYASCSETSGG